MEEAARGDSTVRQGGAQQESYRQQGWAGGGFLGLLRVGGLLIFYQLADFTLSIDRVMHGARDLPRRLQEPV